MQQKLGGDTAGTADPSRPKEYSIPYDIMLSNKTVGKEEERGNLWSYGILSSQITVACDGALLSWRSLNTCLLMGSGK